MAYSAGDQPQQPYVFCFRELPMNACRVLVLTFATALAPGVGFAQGTASIPLSPQEVFAKVQQAVVTVVTPLRQGSGVIVDSSGVIATNLHVVSGTKTANVILPNGDTFDVIGVVDFDSHKDFISRFVLKPYTINKKIEIGGGLSLLLGGWKNGTKYVYESGKNAGGDKIFVVDSSVSNFGRSSPRHYYGADIQIKLHHKWGETECRAEYWFGTQPGTATSTANPGTIPAANGIPLPTYVRHYNGAYFYLLQNIVNTKHQLIIKYDWYDPNEKVNKTEIGKAGTNLTAAEIKFNTIGIGYAYHFNPQTKLIFYYDLVKNESTQLAGYISDNEDNIFTCRLQFRF